MAVFDGSGRTGFAAVSSQFTFFMPMTLIISKENLETLMKAVTQRF